MVSKGSARSYLPIVRGDILPPVAVTVTATVFPKSPNHIPGLTVLVPAPFVSCECSARVRHALTNFGVFSGVNRRKIEVEIKPDDPTADLRGARWAGVDLPVAVAILSAETPGAATDSEILWFGELSLDGAVRPVRGAATVADLSPCSVVIAKEDAELVAVAAPQHTVFAVSDIMGASRVLSRQIDSYVAPITSASPGNLLDMSDIIGLDAAKESVIGAVSQRENILLLGPSGCGRTMLAARVPSVMPPLKSEELRMRAKIISVAGLPPENHIRRPLRCPHHTCSSAGLVGSSTRMVGEVQLAAGGVLMLDDVAQFARSVIDTLASRLRSMAFPPMIILADSPCPCGWAGTRCKCAPEAIDRHMARVEYACQQLSVNTRVDMPLVDRNELATLACQPRESSAEIRERIAQAWKE